MSAFQRIVRQAVFILLAISAALWAAPSLRNNYQLSNVSAAQDPGSAGSGEGATQVKTSVVSDLIGGVWETPPAERKRGKRFDDPDGASRYYLQKRLPVGVDVLPVEKYIEARQRIMSMPRYSTALNAILPADPGRRAKSSKQLAGAWTPLGPGNIGGRTRVVLYHPEQPEIVYAAGVAGGVWRSTNGGATWSPLADTIANIAVNSLVMDPVDPNVLYAGTGEGYFAIDNVRGAGIFKTIDGGLTWIRLANTAGSDFYYVNDLVISPLDSKRIYAATRTGVWRSNDSGDSWSQVYPTTVHGGCTDLAIRTDKPTDTIFAACGNFTQASVLRNTDAGSDGQWVEVLNDSGMGRTAIAIAPSNQDVVYAVTAELSIPYRHGLHAFFRSSAGGDFGSWTPRVRNTDQDQQNKLSRMILSVPPSATATDCKYGTTDIFTGQAWYDLAIAVDPVDENRVWVGGVDLFRSEDGGLTWGLGGFAYLGSSFAIGRVHPDQHVIVFHPQYNGGSNQQMLVGNDGGIFRTDNARAAVAYGPTAPCNPAASGVRWESLNNSYEVTQFYHGVVYPDGTGFFGGTQDNGTVRGTETGGANNWRMISGADGGYGAIDFLSPNILFASTQNTGIRKSSDNGLTFSSATFGLNETGLFITPVVMDPSDPRRLYTGAGSIFRTSDSAAIWNNIGSFRAISETSGGSISAIAVSPTDANSALVGMGTGDGSIIRTNRLLTLSLLNPPSRSNEFVARPRAGWVSSVAFDPTNEDIGYATYSTFEGAHVWRTIDGGISWTAIDGSGDNKIPDLPVHSIVVDPTNTARLFVGTDLGVFVTIDRGANWFIENTGFANVVTETLAINVHDGVVTLFAFTHGRGVYKVVAGFDGCSYSLSGSTVKLPSAGGETSVDVTVNPGGCPWQVRSNASWIGVTSDPGKTTVTVKVQKNIDVAIRAGTVTIAGRSFTVLQDGVQDIIPPVISITSHKGPAIRANQPSILLGGTSSDNSIVTKVKWRSNRGFSGTASGTETWVATIPLVVGSNVITMMATDDSGNIGTAVLTMEVDASSVLVTVAGTGVEGFTGDGQRASQARITRPTRMAFDEAGNLYFADVESHRIRKVGTDGVITTVAGNGLAGYEGDGRAATLARLNSPLGVAIDKNGNLYVADSSNHVIRKVAAGTGTITTIAGIGTPGYGGDGSQGTSALLNGPENICLDLDGNLLIADSKNNRVRLLNAVTGTITTVAGNGVAGFGGDLGAATSALITFPTDVKVDLEGNIYICATGNNRIRRVDRSSGQIDTIVGNGGFLYNGEDIPAPSAAINNPQSIDLDSTGNLYLVDQGNSRIRRIDHVSGSISTIAGGATGFSQDGSPAIGARLSAPTGLAIGPGDIIHFSDRDNSRIRKLLPALTGDTQPPVVTIQNPVGGQLLTTSQNPLSIDGGAIDNGNIALVTWTTDRGKSGIANGTDHWNASGIPLQKGRNSVRITAWDTNSNAGVAQLLVDCFPPQVMVTLAGNGSSGSTGDGGPAASASLWAPVGIAIDNSGSVIFVDGNNRRVRKVTPDGLIVAFAGTGELGSSGDGNAAVSGTMNAPVGIATDPAGNIYIADVNTHRIRKIASNGLISTIAGSGEGFGGFSGDNGPAISAQLRGPSAVAVDRSGNLYIADRGNNRIRKVDASTSIITTVVGTGAIGFSGDGGPAEVAELWLPSGIAFDRQGNLFIADQGNQRIRRVDAVNGIMETIGGTGRSGYNGDGIPATLADISIGFPTGIAVDQTGNVFFTDRNNHRIRRINLKSGLISTVAGTGQPGFSGDGTDPVVAELQFPSGIAVNADGNLFISDTSNNRIRRTLPATALQSVVTLSAASYNAGGGLAPESIVTAFGSGLGTRIESASTLPLPVALAGTSVKVRDNPGSERLAPIFFVSSGQVNYQIPPGTSSGIAEISITNGNGAVSTGTVEISPVSPGIFTANASGEGVAAAVLFRRTNTGQESYQPVAFFDSSANRFVPVAIDLGPQGDTVSLILFGTGIRFNSGLLNASAMVGGVTVPVYYAGLTPGFVGLDQVNLLLDRNLAGKGEVDVVLTVDGLHSRPVRVSFK